MRKRQEERYYCVVHKNGDVTLESLNAQPITREKAKLLTSSILSTLKRPVFVYLGKKRNDDLYKIGMSKTPYRRARELDIEILHTIPCYEYTPYTANRVENILHKLYRKMYLHAEGEWFFLTTFDVEWLSSIQDSLRCYSTSSHLLEKMELAEKLFPIMPTAEQQTYLVEKIKDESVSFTAVYILRFIAHRLDHYDHTDEAIALL